LSPSTSPRAGPPRRPHSFPTRRSSDLIAGAGEDDGGRTRRRVHLHALGGTEGLQLAGGEVAAVPGGRFDVDGKEILETLGATERSEEHTSELQSRFELVCRLLLEKKQH